MGTSKNAIEVKLKFLVRGQGNNSKTRQKHCPETLTQ